ncbi:hypothetical protein BC939DRAFT_6462 [Gamsiella multidivaricata]|uniref:uncharacterized protein n=1 Tax=Gamsiella multidivaricata TaxID=101098 RepID=UPI0022206D98|nr:uncharacterized protein BC939DRAFT_6462 [Gamsiella multidivaricata]KAI7832802.1 hypothetical protein BC939DRAFT_6462 [Gamsiella multidivaricata]
MFSVNRSALTGAVSRSATHIVKRWKSQKSVEVTLRANVQGLGKPGDVVTVAPGRMRNKLYPMRLANYIDRSSQHVMQAFSAGQDSMKHAHEANKVFQQAVKKEQRIIQLQELRHRLQVLPPLVFPRAVNEVLPGSKTIFGSVQVEDVIKELKEKHGIVVDKVTVNGTKIKSIGDSWARVDLGDLGSVELKVVVERR